MHPDEIIAALAASQYGVFRDSQALGKGVTRAQLRSRLQTGHLVRVLPKVLAIGGLPLSEEGRVMAVVLWSEDGVASHRTALRWRRIQGVRPGPIEISMQRSTKGPSGTIIHRPQRLPSWQLTEVRGLPITIVERSLLDSCAVGKPWECSDCIDSALRREPDLLERLQHILEVESKPGRDGIRLLRALLAERDPSQAPPGSVLAGRFLRWLRSVRLPEPDAEYRICGEFGFVKIVDFAYPSDGIGFEVDGYDTHGNKNAFERDRESDDVLHGLGWRIFRITHRIMASETKLIRLHNSIVGALNHQLCSRRWSPGDQEREKS